MSELHEFASYLLLAGVDCALSGEGDRWYLRGDGWVAVFGVFGGFIALMTQVNELHSKDILSDLVAEVRANTPPELLFCAAKKEDR